MTARRLLAGLVAVVTAGAFAVAAAGTSTAQIAPTATVSPGAAAPGSPVIVRGTGFAPGTLVSVELCGNEARRGSADCDQSSALDAGASSTGDVAVQLIVGTPPSPCPCVVKLTGLGSSATASAPFVVSGAPTADAGTLAAQYPDVSRQINVVDAHFTGSGPWTAWFGASPHRELVYTVQNIGNVAVQDPPIIIAVGKSDNPTGIVHPPPLGTLAPGESQTYHTTVDLGAFSWGRYHAVGTIPGFADPVRFTASTTNYPWALILIVVIGLFELILITARNRARKRLARVTDTPALPGPVPALNAGPVLVGAGVAADAPPATATLPPGELEDAIVMALSETLRSMHVALGDRDLSDDEAARLAAALAEEVSASVATTLSISPGEQELIEGHLRTELSQALSGRDVAARSAERNLAGVGPNHS